MAILALAGVTFSESDKVRHSALASEDLTNSLISHNLETVHDRRQVSINH